MEKSYEYSRARNYKLPRPLEFKSEITEVNKS